MRQNGLRSLDARPPDDAAAEKTTRLRHRPASPPVTFANADRLSLAGRFLVTAAVLTFFSLGFMAIDSAIGRRAMVADGAALVRALDLAAPAVFPSGRLSRAPELMHPAIDLRYDPLSGEALQTIITPPSRPPVHDE